MKAVGNRNPHRLRNSPEVHLQQLQEDLDRARDSVLAAAALAKLDPEFKAVENESIDYGKVVAALLRDAVASIAGAHLESEEIEVAISGPKEAANA